MISKRTSGSLSAMIFFVSLMGCDQPPVDSGPSYAELVVTYNAELEALDRLEAKREKLVAEYAVASAPSAAGGTLSNLEGLLKSTRDIQEGKDLDATADPNALLDELTQRSGNAEEIANQLLDGLLGGESSTAKPPPTPEAEAAAAERKTAFEAELASLEAEIIKQQERVVRARQARDAAEKKSP